VRGNLEEAFTNRTYTRNLEEYSRRILFYSIWQFPNCIGATDGKHTEIQAVHNSGSLFNYKKAFSVVLLALVDANYKFVIIDVGG
jgi:hypothetical protein